MHPIWRLTARPQNFSSKVRNTRPASRIAVRRQPALEGLNISRVSRSIVSQMAWVAQPWLYFSFSRIIRLALCNCAADAQGAVFHRDRKERSGPRGQARDEVDDIALGREKSGVIGCDDFNSLACMGAKHALQIPHRRRFRRLAQDDRQHAVFAKAGVKIQIKRFAIGARQHRGDDLFQKCRLRLRSTSAVIDTGGEFVLPVVQPVRQRLFVEPAGDVSIGEPGRDSRGAPEQATHGPRRFEDVSKAPVVRVGKVVSLAVRGKIAIEVDVEFVVAAAVLEAPGVQRVNEDDVDAFRQKFRQHISHDIGLNRRAGRGLRAVDTRLYHQQPVAAARKDAVIDGQIGVGRAWHRPMGANVAGFLGRRRAIRAKLGPGRRVTLWE